MALTTPTTTFTGLASGIDTGSIVDSLVGLAKIPITRLQEKQTTNSRISKKYTELKTKLATLKTAAQALDTRREALVNKGSSSNENAIKISSTGGSTLGTYAMNVTSVAQAERTYSNPQASSSTAGVFGTGDLTIQVGSGDPITVTVDPDDTLETVARKINNAGVAVTAGVMFDGTSYRLQVGGTSTGAANAITFTEDGSLSLGLDEPTNQVQAASDAVFTLDDFPITSATNTVTSALPGVTLTITGEGAANIQIDRDPDGLKTKVQTFVDAYNDIAKFMNAEFASTSGVQKSADSLSGDGTLRALQTELRRTVAQDWSSLGSFATVSSVGVTIGRDGTMSIDSAKLGEAVNEDYESVAALFAGRDGSEGLMAKVMDLVDDQTGADGLVSNRITSLAKKNRDMDKSIERIQMRIDKYQEQLQRQFATLESLTAGLTTQGNALITTLSQM